MRLLMAARAALTARRLPEAETLAREALLASTDEQHLLARAIAAQIAQAKGTTGSLGDLRRLADEEGSLYAQMAIASLTGDVGWVEADARLSEVEMHGGSAFAVLLRARLDDVRGEAHTNGLEDLVLGAPGMSPTALTSVMLVALHAKDHALFHLAYHRRQRLLGRRTSSFAAWTTRWMRPLFCTQAGLLFVGGAVFGSLPALLLGFALGAFWLEPSTWHAWQVRPWHRVRWILFEVLYAGVALFLWGMRGVDTPNGPKLIAQVWGVMLMGLVVAGVFARDIPRRVRRPGL